MDIDEVGNYLEAQGMSDDEIDVVLQHYGVRGQKWGIRKKRSGPPTKAERRKNLYKQTVKGNKTNRRVLSGTTAVAAILVGRKIGLSKAQSAGAGVAGAALVNSMMRVHGAKRLTEI